MIPFLYSSSASLLLVVGLLALRMLHHTPQGVLRWDGVHWGFEVARPVTTGMVSDEASHQVAGELAVHADVQFFLLLSLRSPGNGVCWLWLDRPHETTRWLALRRAVYSPPRAPLDRSADATLEAQA